MLIDYVKEWHDYTFEQLPITTIDMMVLNELGYLPWEQIVTSDSSMDDLAACMSYIKSATTDGYTFSINRSRVLLLEAVVASKRYRGLQVTHVVNDVNQLKEQQFAAMLMSFVNTAYAQVVFRGTDETMVGWKEDFMMTYLNEVPSQRQATLYLKELLGTIDQEQLVLTGHSKGGNLAIYAAAHLPTLLQEKITYILTFDAPGLHRRVLRSKGYRGIMPKICSLKPVDTIVGTMLGSDVSSLYIDCDVSGFSQHSPFHWKTEGYTWQLKSAPSALSRAVDISLACWIKETTDTDLQSLVDSVFTLVERQGLETVDDYLKHRYGIR